MSLAFLRSDLLTELANHGETAADQVEQKVKEFLADSAGSWLPEQFESPHELLDRSFDGASEGGKKVLSRAIKLMINNLYVELKARKLTCEESRQLLGAFAMAKRHPELLNKNFSKLLFFATKRPSLFWRKVIKADDIVGSTKSERETFIRSLWEKLPSEMRAKVVLPVLAAAKTTRGQAAEKQITLWPTFRAPTRKRKFIKALGRGEPVGVWVTVNGAQHDLGLVRLSNCDDFIFPLEELSEKVTQHIPSVDLGPIKLRDNSPRTIANAVPRRVDRIFCETCV